MIGRKVSVLGSNVLKLPCRRIDYLDVAGDVLFSVDLAELTEGFVRNVRFVEFMVPWKVFL